MAVIEYKAGEYMRDNNIETIETTSRDETFELAKSIGMKAQAGQIYLLSGDLGTGFCRGTWNR